jgi:hypothetical protein
MDINIERTTKRGEEKDDNQTMMKDFFFSAFREDQHLRGVLNQNA